MDLANLVMGLATGKGLQGFVKEPTGGSESINKLFGLGKEQAPTSDLLEAVLGMVNPSSAVKGAAISAAALLPMMARAQKGVRITGPGASQRGIIGPAMAFGAKRSDVKEAEQLIAAGKDAEAYKKFSIYADPTTGQLLKVLPDTDAKLNLDKLKWTESQGYNGPTPPIALRFEAGTPNTPLPNVISHPSLYKVAPEMQDTVIGRSIPHANFFPGVGEAAYLQPARGEPATIALGQTLASSAPQGNTVAQLLSNALHEIQHGIQYTFGMPPGGTYRQFFADRDRFDEAAAGLKAANAGGTATAYAEGVLKNAKQEAFKRYSNLPGEVQARLVQKQFETGDYTTHPYDLLREMGIDLQALKPDAFAGHQVDLTPEVQRILDIYAKPQKGKTP